MLFSSIVFAHDCNLVVSSPNTLDETVKNYNINYKIYHNALPTQAFKQALINLKAYCCSQITQKWCTKDEIKNLPKTYPESEYLFDQIFDVAMRRLDGIQTLAYGLDPDPTALERRTYITQTAANANGAQAGDIQNMYNKYWKLHAFSLDNILENYNKDVATVSLADKYTTLCDIMKKIYDIQKEKRVILGGYGENNSFLNKCTSLVEKRVKKENSYVKLLMTQKSANLFDETMKAYTKKHFVEEKLMGLWNLVAKVKDVFKTIVQQAPVAKNCSK